MRNDDNSSLGGLEDLYNFDKPQSSVPQNVVVKDTSSAPVPVSEISSTPESDFADFLQPLQVEDSFRVRSGMTQGLGEITNPFENDSFLRRITLDPAVMAVKAGVGSVGMLIGAADLGITAANVIGGLKLPSVGKSIEPYWNTNEQLENLDSLYSPSQEEAKRRVAATDSIGGAIVESVKNPSTIVEQLAASAPGMALGGVIGKATESLLPVVGPKIASALGEGAVTVFQNMEAARAENPNGELTPTQTGYVILSGVLTGLINRASGATAKWLGVEDIDQFVVDKKLSQKAGNAIKKILGGSILEGLEEFFQSGEEQALQNLASEKPVGEGVAQAMGLGLVTGVAQSAPLNAASAFLPETPKPKPEVLQSGTKEKVVADFNQLAPPPIPGAKPTYTDDTPHNKQTQQGVAFTPRVQLKDGVEVTVDHVAYLLENNMNFSPPAAMAGALIATQLAKKDGLTLNEFVRGQGLNFQGFSEKAPGFEYEFMAKPGNPTGESAKLVKLEDGTWRLNQYAKIGDETPLSTTVIPDADIFKVAASLRNNGMQSSTFSKEVAESRQIPDPDDFTIRRNIVEGYDIVDRKGKPIATAFDSMDEANSELRVMKQKYQKLVDSMPEELFQQNSQKTPGEEMRDLTLQTQVDAGWNPTWPIVPADLMDADKVEAIRTDPSLSEEERTAILSFVPGGEGDKAITSRTVRDPAPGLSDKWVGYRSQGYTKKDGKYVYTGGTPEELFKTGSIEGTPFYLSAPRKLLSPEIIKLPPKTKLNGDVILSRLSSLSGMKPVEIKAYEELGLTEYLKEKRTIEEVADWMEKNGPKVEVRKLSADATSAIRQELAEVTHQLDTLHPNWVTEARRGGVELQSSANETVRKLWERYVDLVHEESSTADRGNDSATARFQFLNPKKLEEMPDAVDILVKIPPRNLIEHPKYDAEQHYDKEGKNLVVHVRGYMETLPSGEKVFHVFEVQSDWAQSLQKRKSTLIKNAKSAGYATDEAGIKAFIEDKYLTIPGKAQAWGVYNGTYMGDPLLSNYESLALKAAIDHAVSQGATRIAISDGETAMITEKHDQDVRYTDGQYEHPELKGTYLEGYNREGQELTGTVFVEDGKVLLETVASANSKSKDKIRHDGLNIWVSPQYAKESFPELPKSIKQEKGMRLHYDKILPKLMAELTGDKGEVVDFGEHQNVVREGYPAVGEQVLNTQPRTNLIFKNQDGTPKTTITARSYSLEKVASEFSLFKKGQVKLGVTQFYSTGEKLIKLFEGSNFSTLIHEYGHIVFPLLTKDHMRAVATWVAKDAASADKILTIMEKKIAGKRVTKAETELYIRVHERFSNTLEEYFRTGKAPNVKLKGVFAYAKNILMKVYQGLKKVPGSNLTPEISKVFDEILMSNDEKFGGVIRIPSTKTSRGVTAPVDHKIINWKGKATVKISVSNPLQGMPNTDVYVDVEGLILGNPLTQEQREHLGDRPTWVSPDDAVQKYSEFDAMVADNSTVHSLVELDALPIKVLYKLALELGVKDALKRYPDRKVLAEIVQEIQVQNAAASGSLDQDDMQNALEEIIIRALPPDGSKNIISAVWKNWTWWMIDRVRRAGKPGAVLPRVHADKLQKATDKTHASIGEQAKAVEKVQLLTRWPGFSKGAKELQDGRVITDSSGRNLGFVSNLAIWTDDSLKDYRVGELSPAAKKILDALQEFLDLQGRIAQREKMSIKVKINGEDVIRPFHPVGERFPRIYTEDFWRLLTSPDGRMRKQYANLIARSNPDLPRKEIDQWIESIYAKAKTDQRIYMELERKIKVMPTHIWVPGAHAGGYYVQLLESNPFDYVKRLQVKLALRVGMYSQYSTEVPAVKNPNTGRVEVPATRVIDHSVLTKHIEDFQRETGEGVELQRAFRAASGVPVSDTTRFGIDSPGYRIYQAFHNLYLVRGALMLTQSFIVNVWEPPTKGLALVGPRMFLKTSAQIAAALPAHIAFKTRKLFGGNPSPDAWSVMKQQAMEWGTMNEHLAHFTWDPRKKVASLSRGLGDMITKVSGATGAMSFGEFYVAMMGHNLAENLKNKRGSQADIARLKILYFSEAEIQRMLEGRTDPETQKLYQAIPTRMVTTQLGTNTLPMERSKWRNWRFASDIIKFDSYGANTFRFMDIVARQFLSSTRGTAKAQQEGFKNALINLVYLTTSPVRSKEVRNFLIGGTLSGVAIAASRQFVKYGLDSFKYVDWDGDDDENTATEWLQFLADCFLQSAISGPPANLYYNLKHDQDMDVKNTVGRVIMPVNALLEVLDMLRGTGQYAKKNLWESAVHFAAGSSFAAQNSLATWWSIVAFGHKDPTLAYSTSEFWKHYKEYNGVAGYNDSKEYAEWQLHIGRAYEAMKNAEKNFDPQTGAIVPSRWNKEVDNKVWTELKLAYDLSVAEKQDRRKGIEQTFEKGVTREEGKKLAEAWKDSDPVKASKERLIASVQGKQLLRRLSPEQKIKFKKSVSEATYQKLVEHDWMIESYVRALKGESK